MISPFVWLLPFLVIPLENPNRDWRYLEEFNSVREWRYYDGDSHHTLRWTEVQCPPETPLPLYVYIHSEDDWLVDHVELGWFNEWNSFQGSFMSYGQVDRQEWRARVGDFDHKVPDYHATYIRVWAIKKE